MVRLARHQDGGGGVDGLEAVGPRTDRALVEGRVKERIGAEAFEEMPRHDADGGVRKERSEGLRERHFDGEGVGRAQRGVAEERRERGVAAESRLADGLEREHDVVSGERLTVLPQEPAPEMKDVPAAVVEDVPRLREVGLGQGVGPQPDEAREDEAAEGLVGLVEGGEQRIDALRLPGHPFDVDAARGWLGGAAVLTGDDPDGHEARHACGEHDEHRPARGGPHGSATSGRFARKRLRWR